MVMVAFLFKVKGQGGCGGALTGWLLMVMLDLFNGCGLWVVSVPWWVWMLLVL